MLAVLRQRNFALVWAGGLISYTGDWLLFVGLPLFVYQLTGSTLATGAAVMVRVLPRLVLGSVAGVFVDRWDRRRTMIAANLLLGFCLLPLLAVRSVEWLWVLYLVSFVQSVLAQFLGPAENALLPRLVDEELLVPANALNGMNDNLARLVGPPIGGLVVGVWGLGGAALLDAASFFVAAGLVALVVVDGRAARAVTPEATAELTAEASRVGPFAAVWREWRAGLALVRRTPLLRSLFIVLGVSLVADSILTALLIPFIEDEVGGGAQALGGLLTIRGVAGLLGGVVIGWVGPRVPPARLLGVSLVGVGLLFLVQVNYPAVWLVAALLLLSGPFIIGWLTSQQTLLQTGSPDEYRGRVFGAYGTTASLTLLVGSGLASALGEAVGIVPLLNASALLYVAAGVVALVLLRGVVIAAGSEAEVGEAAPAMG